MNTNWNRRDFIIGSAAAAAFAAALPLRAAGEAAPAKRRLRKAIMWGTVGAPGSVLEKMRMVKAAGFNGAEMNSHMDVDEVLRARDEAALEIPSVCCSHHWKTPLTHPDPAVRAESVEGVRQALREAKRYGATSILLVPGAVSKETSYAEAYQRSQAELRKLIPAAEETGVKIALENVWNHFLLSPLEAARFVDELASPMVGWHFDAGNIVNYGWPEQWIRILGKRILKVHVKEFSRGKRDKEGLWKGFDVPLTEGDVDWPAVMKALDEIGYGGWMITEQGGGGSQEGLNDLSARLDKIIKS
jgi:hexulose-6-phosphate isomerase